MGGREGFLEVCHLALPLPETVCESRPDGESRVKYPVS